jgi:hypothetical protein
MLCFYDACALLLIVMSKEGLLVAVQEQTAALDAAALIQAELAVTAEEAQDLASVQLVCTSPNAPPDATMSLGEFIGSDHANEKVSGFFASLREERDDGHSWDMAIRATVGKTAVSLNRETGKLARVPSQVDDLKKN